MAITEYSECAVTVRGTYFPPGKGELEMLSGIVFAFFACANTFYFPLI